MLPARAHASDDDTATVSDVSDRYQTVHVQLTVVELMKSEPRLALTCPSSSVCTTNNIGPKTDTCRTLFYQLCMSENLLHSVWPTTRQCLLHFVIFCNSLLLFYLWLDLCSVLWSKLQCQRISSTWPSTTSVITNYTASELIGKAITALYHNVICTSAHNKQKVWVHIDPLISRDQCLCLSLTRADVWLIVMNRKCTQFCL